MSHNKLTSCTVIDYHHNCFDKLSLEELKYIKNNEIIINYKKGETICKQGTFASHVMVMEKGLAKVFLEGKSENLILKIIPAGNILGLTSVPEANGIRTYSASAYVDSVVRLIDIKVFRNVVSQNPAFALEVINLLSANSNQINGRFFCLAHKQTYGKLADIILCLANNVFKTDEFDLMLSRKDLAELSGMSTESVIRILKKFKQERLIKMEGKKFKVLNKERLESISVNG